MNIRAAVWGKTQYTEYAIRNRYWNINISSCLFVSHIKITWCAKYTVDSTSVNIQRRNQKSLNADVNMPRPVLGCTYLTRLPPCWKPLLCRSPHRHLSSPPAQPENYQSFCDLIRAPDYYKIYTPKEPSSHRYLTVKIQVGNTISTEILSPISSKSSRTDIIDPRSADVGGVFDVI